MNYPAADDLKEQVREATDIVALLGAYLQLIPQGRNFVALCPFHDDSRPSLTVNPERQTWKCWPCDQGGDVFSFVMLRENVDFPGALRILAERAGIELRRRPAGAAGTRSNEKVTLYQAMAWSEDQFHHFLLDSPQAEAARDYLKRRQISDETIRRFQIGFAPNQWRWLLDRAKKTAFSSEMLETIGLAIKPEHGSSYDRFRGRVMFPVRDTQNRPIGVGGRILPEFADDKSPKYINSPETRLYSKSEQLYGLNLCRSGLEQQRKQNKPRNVIVMEGYTDVAVAHQAGMTTCVAVCGTAIGARHMNVLKRYADRVTLVLDGDEAGQRRAAEVLELFVAHQIDLRIVTLPGDLDPCEYVLQQGPTALETLIEDAPDALAFCVARETQGIDLANDTQRASTALQKIVAVMARAPKLKQDTDTVFRLREQQTLSRLSRMFSVDEPLLRQQLASIRSTPKPGFQRGGDAPGSRDTNRAEQASLDGWEKELFVLLIQCPEVSPLVVEKLAAAEMKTEYGKALLQLYHQLQSRGVPTEHQHVMDATEDPALKNILAELADAADRTHVEDQEHQVNELLTAFAARRERQHRRQQLARLEAGKLADQEELEILNRLIESKRLES